MAIEASSASEVSRYVGKVCSLYSQWRHGRKGGCGTLWQGSYKSILVQKDGYLLRLARYIERNPLAAKIKGVKRPWGYQWSSAKAYVSLQDDRLVCVRKHPYWEQIGASDPERRAYYRNLLLGKDASDAMLFASNRSVVGDDDFKGSCRLIFGRLSPAKAGRRRKRQQAG